MKITTVTTVTVACCKVTKTFNGEHDALEWFLNHIKQKHPVIYKQIEQKGRTMAMSQNGCGYYDDGKHPKNGGWWTAQPTFRDAWRKNALEDKFFGRPV